MLHKGLGHISHYRKPLIISFCSSLGSTLLLIERTTIDPLHLWVINAMRGMDIMLGEEHRRQASLRVARYQQALGRYRCHSVRSRTLEVGNLVLRRVLSREGLHKLSPMWEGPFKVVHVSRPGTARLETQDGVPIPNAWNIQHPRKFYP